MTKSTPVNLDAIRAAANAATPGPWVTDVEIDGMYAGCKTVVRAMNADPWRSRIVTVGQTRMHISADGADEANVAFIAAARELVPAMAAEIERLRANVERLQEDLDGAHNSAWEQREHLKASREQGDLLRAQRDAVLALCDTAERYAREYIKATGDWCDADIDPDEVRAVYAEKTGAESQ